MTTDELGTFVKVFDDGAYWTIQPHEEPRIDAAVSDYVDSGGGRDRLLQLDAMDGDRLKILASSIRSWFISTPEGRRRNIELEKIAADETKEVRQSLGIWSEEEGL